MLGGHVLGSLLGGRQQSEEQEMFFPLLAPMVGSAVMGALSGREQDEMFIKTGLARLMGGEQLTEEQEMFFGPLIAGAAIRGILGREDNENLNQEEELFLGGLVGGLVRGGLSAGLRGGLRGGLRAGLKAGVRGGVRSLGRRPVCVMRSRSGRCLRY